MNRFLLSAVAALSLFSANALALPPPEVRVLIAEGPEATVEGALTPLRIATGDPRGGSGTLAGMRATLIAGPKGLVHDGTPIGPVAGIVSRQDRFRIAGRLYRGEIRVTWEAEGKLLVVDVIPLEDYLVGLIGSEISPAWPAEAQKAQAVAARTYALHHAQAVSVSASPRAYDVTSSVLSQVYDGVHKEDNRAREAVAATRGQVLERDGRIFPAYYHSCCGGRTEHARNVWEDASGPPVIEDGYCERSPRHDWSWRSPLAAFTAKLAINGIAIGRITDVAIEGEPDNPRIANLIIADENGAHAVKATELRRIFGFSEIKSTWFEPQLAGNEIRFTGRGYGHGVGMCQWGSKGMADAGKGYREILKFYYPDAELITAY